MKNTFQLNDARPVLDCPKCGMSPEVTYSERENFDARSFFHGRLCQFEVRCPICRDKTAVGAVTSTAHDEAPRDLSAWANGVVKRWNLLAIYTRPETIVVCNDAEL